jgi:hypothetical protein
MAATTVKMQNPETGGVGNVEINRLQDALADGMVLAQDVEFFNPETQGVGKIPVAQVGQALNDGLLPVGSRAHTVATTGKLESFARGAAQGLTAGFADEIVGGIESLASDKTYKQARDESRANFAVASEANPVTSTLGSLAGGVGSAAIPGLGTVGSGLAGALATGAKLGAINALGNSNADLTEGQVGDATLDTLKGAGVGALLGGATDVGSKALRFAGSKIQDAASKTFDPFLQRALSFGAKTKDLREGGPLVDKLRRSISKFDELGGFARADGRLPGDKDLLGRLTSLRAQTTDGLKKVVDGTGGLQLDIGDVVYGLDDATADIIRRATPDAQPALQAKLDDIKRLVVDSEGDISKLLQLKRDSGGWAKFDATKPVSENQLYQAVNGALDDEVTAAIDLAARRVGGEKAQLLSELNSRYEAVSTLERLAFDKAAKDAAATQGIFSLKDVAGGGAGAAAGSLVGGPVGATLGYGAAILASKAVQSTEGRLLRAQVGQAVQQKAAQVQQAVAQGAIPRTIDGLKSWLQVNMPFVQQVAPQLAPVAQRLMQEQGSAAQQTVRALMPMITQYMTPSTYLSEFEGKVFEPEDRLKISQQLDDVPGLTTEQKAARLSSLNKDGTIPPEVYVPTPAPTIDSQLSGFSDSLGRIGY